MTFARRRTIRILLRVVAAAVVLVAAFACWALLWPAPDGAKALECEADDPPNCRAAHGRVVYVPRKDRAERYRALHLVLLSRDSVALPLITVVKIPAVYRPRKTPRLGRWVSVVGRPHRGSNGETDIGVERYLMP